MSQLFTIVFSKSSSQLFKLSKIGISCSYSSKNPHVIFVKYTWKSTKQVNHCAVILRISLLSQIRIKSQENYVLQHCAHFKFRFTTKVRNFRPVVISNNHHLNSVKLVNMVESWYENSCKVKSTCVDIRDMLRTKTRFTRNVQTFIDHIRHFYEIRPTLFYNVYPPCRVQSI